MPQDRESRFNDPRSPIRFMNTLGFSGIFGRNNDFSFAPDYNTPLSNYNFDNAFGDLSSTFTGEQAQGIIGAGAGMPNNTDSFYESRLQANTADLGDRPKKGFWDGLFRNKKTNQEIAEYDEQYQSAMNQSMQEAEGMSKAMASAGMLMKGMQGQQAYESRPKDNLQPIQGTIGYAEHGGKVVGHESNQVAPLLKQVARESYLDIINNPATTKKGFKEKKKKIESLKEYANVNEMVHRKEIVSSLMNRTGYTPGTKTFGNPFNIIPGGEISMENTPFPVTGIPINEYGSPVGEPITMEPGSTYRFADPFGVLEIPRMQYGGSVQKYSLPPKTSETLGNLAHNMSSYFLGTSHPNLIESGYQPTTANEKGSKYVTYQNLKHDVVADMLSDTYIGNNNRQQQKFSKEQPGYKPKLIKEKNFNEYYNYLKNEQLPRSKKAGVQGSSINLGQYALDVGKDEKGKYISIYDKYDWNLLEQLGFDGNSFEVYDRIYEDEFEKIKNRRVQKDQGDKVTPISNEADNTRVDQSQLTMQMGGTVNPMREMADSVTAQYADLNFVKRALNPDKYPALDAEGGKKKTHKLAYTEADGKYWVHPTIFMDEDGSLSEVNNSQDKFAAFKEAKKRGELIPFDSKEAAEYYSKNGLIDHTKEYGGKVKKYQHGGPINNTMKNNRYIQAFQMGGPVEPEPQPQPIQTEKGEYVTFPDGTTTKTLARKSHSEMSDDEVTDVVMSGSMIWSNDPQLTLSPDDYIAGKMLSEIAIGKTPIVYSENEPQKPSEDVKLLDGFNKKKFTPADYAKHIKNKMPVTDREDDAFATLAQNENKSQRLEFLAAMAEVANYKKDAVEVTEGLDVQQPKSKFQFGGSLKSLTGSGMSSVFKQPTDTAITGQQFPEDPYQRMLKNRDKAAKGYDPSLFKQNALRGLSLNSGMGTGSSSSFFNFGKIKNMQYGGEPVQDYQEGGGFPLFDVIGGAIDLGFGVADRITAGNRRKKNIKMIDNAIDANQADIAQGRDVGMGAAMANFLLQDPTYTGINYDDSMSNMENAYANYLRSMQSDKASAQNMATSQANSMALNPNMDYNELAAVNAQATRQANEVGLQYNDRINQGRLQGELGRNKYLEALARDLQTKYNTQRLGRNVANQGLIGSTADAQTSFLQANMDNRNLGMSSKLALDNQHMNFLTNSGVRIGSALRDTSRALGDYYYNSQNRSSGNTYVLNDADGLVGDGYRPDYMSPYNTRPYSTINER